MDPNNPDPNNPNPPASTTSASTPDLSSVLQGSPTATPAEPLPPPPPLPPLTTDPLSQTPATDSMSPPTWTTPPEPAPTLAPEPLTQPQPETQQVVNPPTWPPADAVPTPSMDNPLNVPVQPPVIDGGVNPSLAQDMGQNAAPSWQPENTDYTPPQPTDTAPTDLSHLVDNSPQQEIPSNYTTPVTQPETLVVPPNGGETVAPSVPMEGGHSGIPKWVIGVGAALLLAVVGASAYFILGIGRPVETTSLPAVEETSQQLSTPPTPLPTPQTATSSGFGALGASPTPAATSAADLIRQRQQSGQ